MLRSEAERYSKIKIFKNKWEKKKLFFLLIFVPNISFASLNKIKNYYFYNFCVLRFILKILKITKILVLRVLYKRITIIYLVTAIK